jgi:hypothetical protein
MSNVNGQDVEFRLSLTMSPFSIERAIPVAAGSITAVSETSGTYPSPGKI